MCTALTLRRASRRVEVGGVTWALIRIARCYSVVVPVHEDCVVLTGPESRKAV